jgi:hypothetical protein
MRRLLLAAAIVAACKGNDYNNNRTKCGPGGACPTGQVCGSDGYCAQGGTADGGASPDSIVVVPDGPLASADAAAKADAFAYDGGPADATPQLPITVTFNDPGGGTITLTENGMSCSGRSGDTCTLYADIGSTVHVTDTPDADSSFVYFAGDCGDGVATCTLTMNGVKNIVIYNNKTLAALTLTSTGAGAIALDPAVATQGSCGANCVYVAVGTQVQIDAAPGIGDSATWTGCATAVDPLGPCEMSVGADTTVNADFAIACPYDYVIDPVNGDDTATGTCGDPFQTISHALLQADGVPKKIRALPGDYATGETFPLFVTGTLVGDPQSYGSQAPTPTRILGGGLDANYGTNVGVELASSSQVQGFAIRPGAAAICVGVNSQTAAIIDHDDLSSAGVGIELLGASNVDVDVDTIRSNQLGMKMIASSAVEVSGTTISANGIGLEMNINTGTPPDLGGGGDSGGGNTIDCNTQEDFHNLGGGTGLVPAQSDYFDHIPLTKGCTFSGEDVCDPTGTLSFDTSASTATGACP